MSTLLVAPGGGHLEEMWQLHQRLPLDDDVLWVTTDTDQSRSMLANASTSFEAAVAQASGRRVTIRRQAKSIRAQAPLTVPLLRCNA